MWNFIAAILILLFIGYVGIPLIVGIFSVIGVALVTILGGLLAFLSVAIGPIMIVCTIIGIIYLIMLLIKNLSN